MSKRDDIVGEKAKAVLNKWREALSSQESENQKLPNDSKKENVNKESKSSNKYILSHEKTIHSQKQTSHNHEQKHNKSNSVSPSLSEQSSKKYINGSCNTNNSSQSGHTLYQYEVQERSSKYTDYDPHTDTSEGYNPECPELFPSDKPVKTKKTVLVETYEPSSVKRKLTDEKEDKSHQKKFKSSSHSNSDNAAEYKKSSEKKDKHSVNREKDKHSSTLKKESNKVKSHSESTKRHESASDAKKTKCKESSENDRTKSKKSKVKIHAAEEFTSSEVSFEDCLGFNDIVPLKKSSKSHSSKKQSSGTTPSKERPTEKSKKDPQKTVSPVQKVQVSKDSSSNPNKGKVSSVSKSKDSYKHNKEASFTVPKPVSILLHNFHVFNVILLQFSFVILRNNF